MLLLEDLKELLRFTVEKRMTLDRLAHFSQEFTFSYKLRNLVLRHPQYFYLSESGDHVLVGAGLSSW
jgi:hypothetical protein